MVKKTLYICKTCHRRKVQNKSTRKKEGRDE